MQMEKTVILRNFFCSNANALSIEEEGKRESWQQRRVLA
jgi:hypothetical protein